MLNVLKAPSERHFKNIHTPKLKTLTAAVLQNSLLKKDLQSKIPLHMSNAGKFLQTVNSPFKFKLFMLAKLPSAFFAGVRVVSADEEKCLVKVPYIWFSQNPFKSTYFACLSMAAEMTTGVLGLAHIYKRQPAVSMLVLKIEGDFVKKATGITIFTCEDGAMIKQTIEDAVMSGEGKTVTAKSYGRNAADEIVAEFAVTWSFKLKKVI